MEGGSEGGGERVRRGKSHWLFLAAPSDRRGPATQVRREGEIICLVQSFLCWLSEIW